MSSNIESIDEKVEIELVEKDEETSQPKSENEKVSVEMEIDEPTNITYENVTEQEIDEPIESYQNMTSHEVKQKDGTVENEYGSFNNSWKNEIGEDIEDSIIIDTSEIEFGGIEKKKDEKPKKERFLSLDVFRGMTVFFMVWVIIWPLAEGYDMCWLFCHNPLGETVSAIDFIFPFFLLIMGYAMEIVNTRPPPPPEKMNDKVKNSICCCCKFTTTRKRSIFIMKWYRVFKRTILLFLIGWLLVLIYYVSGTGDEVNYPPTDYFPIFGVLQRIAAVYFVMTLVLTFIKSVVCQILTLCCFHMIYILLIHGVPWKCANYRSNVITSTCNGETEVDKTINIGYDPNEWGTNAYGIVSTLSAFSSCYMGCLFCKIANYVKRNHNNSKIYIISFWMLLSSVYILLGMIFNRWLFEYTQKIWSTSFVFLTGGVAGFILAWILLLVDVWKIKFWIHIFVWYGMNPLVVYMAVNFCWVFARMIPVEVGGEKYELPEFICYYTLFIWIREGTISMLIFGLIFMTPCICCAGCMHWRKIYVKL